MSRNLISWLGVAIAGIIFIGVVTADDRKIAKPKPIGVTVTTVGTNSEGVDYAVQSVDGHPDWYKPVRSDGRGGWMQIGMKTFTPDNSTSPFDAAKAVAEDALARSNTKQPAVVESENKSQSIEIIEPVTVQVGGYNDPFSGQMYTGG